MKSKPVSVARLRDLYVVQGLTLREMAAVLGVADRTVSTKVKAAGFPPRSKRNRLAVLSWDQVGPMAEFGVSQTAIARHFGVTPASVSQFFIRHGVHRGRGHRRSRSVAEFLASRDELLAQRMAERARAERAIVARHLELRNVPVDRRLPGSEPAGGATRVLTP